ELRESLEARYKEEAEEATKSSIEAALVAEMLKQAKANLPKTMIDKEVETMLTQTAMQMQQYGMDIQTMFTPENVAQMKERTRPEAIENLTRSLALLEVGKRESLQPEATEIEKRIQEVIAELGDRDFDKERLRQVVEEDLIKEKTLEWLTEQSEVELLPQGSLTEEKTEETPTETEQQQDVEAATATVEVAAEEV
ncbi:MAG: trigger factor, partial [Spirulinaceae cyanobacterium]